MLKRKYKWLLFLIAIPLLILALTLIPSVGAHGNGNSGIPKLPPIPLGDDVSKPPPLPTEEELQQARAAAAEQAAQKRNEMPPVIYSESVEDDAILNAVWEKVRSDIELPDGAVLVKQRMMRHRRNGLVTGTCYVYKFKHYVNGYRVDGDSFVVQVALDTLRVEILEQPWTTPPPPAPEIPASELTKPGADYEAALVDTRGYVWEKGMKPPMYHPCWVNVHGKNPIIDIATAKRLGYTVSWNSLYDSPSGASYGGPYTCPAPGPGDDPGTPFWSNADQWFNTFGFASTPSYYNEGAAEVSYYSRPEVSYHYFIAHATSEFYLAECPNIGIFYYDIETLLENRHPMELGMLMGCHAMDSIGADTLEGATRKYEVSNTCTVGAHDADDADWSPYYGYMYQWQDYFFDCLDSGDTICDAFYTACEAYEDASPYMLGVGGGLSNTVKEHLDNPFVSCGLADELPHVNLAYGYKNGTYYHYNPDWPYDENTLKQLEKRFGYWVDMDSARTVDYGPSWSYSLDSGENLIGWVSRKHTSDGRDNPAPEVGFASILDHLVMVYGWEDGDWTWYNPDWPPEENTLTELDVGSGYWVEVDASCWLTYGQNTYARLNAGWNLIGWKGYRSDD